MSRKQRRLTLIAGIFSVAILAVVLTLTALRQTVALFYTPTSLAELSEQPTGLFRLGGLVEEGSISYDANNAGVSFVVADEFSSVPVFFAGVLPDLFREGQGVVIQGRINEDHTITASEVLAKHDETYMPAEVADALKEQGRWKENEN